MARRARIIGTVLLIVAVATATGAVIAATLPTATVPGKFAIVAAGLFCWGYGLAAYGWINNG